MKKIVLSILILTFAWNVKAQDDLAPINTGAVNFLTITPDARSAGMGGASVALPGNNNAVFYNGATSVISPENGGVTYTFAPIMRDYDSGHSLNSLGGFYKINQRNVILGGFRYYNYPSLDVFNSNNEELTNCKKSYQNNILEIKIPNNIPIKITYTATVNAKPGDSVNIANRNIIGR